MAGRPPARLEAFAAWFHAFGDAWEHADADEMAGLFVLGASYQPAPFAELVRGRRQVSEHWRTLLTGMRDVHFRAQVLGVGDTYGAAHFRVSWVRPGSATATLRDGVLLAALDKRGRCTSLREWSHETADAEAVDFDQEG
ncbi:hypothetical protein BH24CHL7_BH24CHL7_13110 [soil metagenome]